MSFRIARLIGRGHYDEAITELSRSLKGSASDAYTLATIADLHSAMGRKIEAIAAARRALDLKPNDFTCHALLADLLARNNDHDGAAVHYRKGLEAYPEPPARPPKGFMAAFKFMAYVFPRLSRADPNTAVREIDREQQDWFYRAKEYLSWYDTHHAKTLNPKIQ